MASMRRTRTFRAIPHQTRLLRALSLGAALSLFGAGGASAQFAYGYVGTYRAPIYEDEMAPMPPRAVVYRLQDRGFAEISRPRFDGRAYIVDATSPAGNRVRLYVDAGDGSIFGRQRLDMPPPARVARAAPGYGWTEDDAAGHRRAHNPEGLLPPGDIPLPRPSLSTEVDRAPKLAARPGDAGPFGVNPDARPGAKADPRKADKAAPRKTAKLAPPAKPAAPRVAPEAPVPTVAPADQAAPNAAVTPEPAKVPDVVKAPHAVTAPADLPKADTAPLLPAAKLPVDEGKAAETSAAPQVTDKPAETPAPAEEKAAAAPAADKPAAEKPTKQVSTDRPATATPVVEVPQEAPRPEAKEAANQMWQDPPTGEARRKVRVIGGTSTVPGTGASSGETAAPAAN
ncbi:hypothetical protein [Methylobacterium gnaphalii]|uniref:Uncharacterized protein n=1 Tax=Methylobacterium gnaphalii TaxID=1010610 RepID=A0A512JDY9_9HYPH|nr:hypothetical protein [Methylobacterium gnaphalii]GEP08170.1 hypothetical protein MGN01_00150 [Methylobacterium gnaphalii]GJD68233.1 hypothetical protein MMMDOFMJ_1152 [Methylobacterium gnaphalii]GLS51199.1 hypothetical protein GCM10007885_40530 [Methylobacterium gnaphalii]